MRSFLLLGILGLALTGCTGEDSRDAWSMQWIVEPAVELGQQAQVIMAVTSLDADVDPNLGVNDAALEIKAAIEFALPCAEVKAYGPTLDITYGALDGNCSFRGMTLQGTHSMTVQSNTSANVVIEHSWKNLSDGRVSLTGGGTVSRFGGGTARKVTYMTNGSMSPMTWSVLPSTGEPGFVADAEGSFLEGGSDVQIIDAEFRWGDPVPHTGRYVIEHMRTTSSPEIPTDTLEFERIDETTIELRWPDDNRVYHVSVDGTIELVSK